MEHVRASPTSFIVYWDPPTTTPLGYIIFYNLTGGDVCSARVNASSSSRTQSYELGGINEGSNYSVSMAAISRHLPSPAVGSPILSGEHQQDWPQLGHCVCVLKCCLARYCTYAMRHYPPKFGSRGVSRIWHRLLSQIVGRAKA